MVSHITMVSEDVIPYLRRYIKFDINQLDDIELDGVDMKDYPDFCDAYVESASLNGVELTDEELEELNDSDETRSWVNAHAYESLY
mgnify:CR=1 FL=1